jgi:hypothetical protein
VSANLYFEYGYRDLSDPAHSGSGVGIGITIYGLDF